MEKSCLDQNVEGHDYDPTFPKSNFVHTLNEEGREKQLVEIREG